MLAFFKDSGLLETVERLLSQDFDALVRVLWEDYDVYFSLRVFVVCLKLRQSEERRSFISLNKNQSVNILLDHRVSLSLSFF